MQTTESTESDHELLQRFAEGDDTAFENRPFAKITGRVLPLIFNFGIDRIPNLNAASFHRPKEIGLNRKTLLLCPCCGSSAED